MPNVIEVKASCLEQLEKYCEENGIEFEIRSDGEDVHLIFPSEKDVEKVLKNFQVK